MFAVNSTQVCKAVVIWDGLGMEQMDCFSEYDRSKKRLLINAKQQLPVSSFGFYENAETR